MADTKTDDARLPGLTDAELESRYIWRYIKKRTEVVYKNLSLG